MEKSVDPKSLDYDFKKLKKNGYIQLIVLKSIDGVNKDEHVITNSNEFGTLDDKSIITCYTKDGDEVMIQKSDLELVDEPKKDDKDKK
ncbi:MAG: hypothetical protein NC548_30980 [Lachnospiraceae bacterium]|nr:hypothetical protein [Lachnospiraceae bacterium]